MPRWTFNIDVSDVFHNDSMSFEEIRDAVVSRLRASAWMSGRDSFDDLVEAVDNLAETRNTDEFDNWWSQIYDYADYDRAWIKTF